MEDPRPARRFRPKEPRDLQEAGLPDGLVEGLVARHLYNSPGASGRALAHDIGLRPRIVIRILEDFKMRRLVVHRSAAAMGDFYYELTEEGREMARGLLKDSRYAGPAPVPLSQYVESVKLQAISTEKPKMPQLRGAFADLNVPDSVLNRIGPAVTHGKGLFMYGPPGNGKTSLAERITRAYGSTVYLPYAIYAGGHIIQVFDPAVHVPVDESDVQPGQRGERLDRRWIRCRRPTVIVGGELTMDALDVAYDEVEGICEAPIQVKANCGTLVIDDFGRQRMQPDELLNRWIVPLEKQVDFIALPGGRKEAFPFECLLVFSTNMEPKDLVDEAFLRRIPYKLEITDPDESTFRALLDSQCRKLGMTMEEGVADYLISTHFRARGRPMRYCHPRDLMLQVANLRRFREEEPVVDREAIDEAVLLYFSLL
ncbi:MAG: AAA family ATPase [Deltaproteobacteria bacterium]|nr:MAG: AAA family ATPase [Deltaproteobacteria bacterium]